MRRVSVSPRRHVFSALWRMPACRYPLTSDHDGDHMVELQRHNGRTAAHGTPEDPRPIFTPPEMSRPTLATRVKQPDTPPGYWVMGMCLGPFEAVTHPTGKPQIFFFVRATSCFWNDVIDLQQPENILL